MASGWLKFSFAILIFTQCVINGAEAGAVSTNERKEDSATPFNLAFDAKGEKPSAHIVASDLGDVSYEVNTVITDWSTSDPLTNLEGGMTYEDGKLMVPEPGTYFIYANFHFRSEGRVQILLNNDMVSLIISPMIKGGAPANANGMGLFVLEAGDTISLRINPWGAPEDGSVKFWFENISCYFGAFLI